jgi:hypothetical protein
MSILPASATISNTGIIGRIASAIGEAEFGPRLSTHHCTVALTRSRNQQVVSFLFNY